MTSSTVSLRQILQASAVAATGVGFLVTPLGFPIALAALGGLAVTAQSREHKYQRGDRHRENQVLKTDLARRLVNTRHGLKLEEINARKALIMSPQTGVHPAGWAKAFKAEGILEYCEAELAAANAWMLKQQGYISAEVLEEGAIASQSLASSTSTSPARLPRISTEVIDRVPEGATLIPISTLNNVDRYPVVMAVAGQGAGKSATMGAIMRELSGFKAIASPKPLNEKMCSLFDVVFGYDDRQQQWLNFGSMDDDNCLNTDDKRDLSFHLHSAKKRSSKFCGSILDFLWGARRESMNRQLGTTENTHYWRCFFDEASYTYGSGFNDPLSDGKHEKRCKTFVSGVNKDAFQNFRGQKVQMFFGAQVDTVGSIGLENLAAAKDEAWFLYPGLDAIVAAKQYDKHQLAQWLKRRVDAGFGIALLIKSGQFFEVLELPTIAELSALVKNTEKVDLGEKEKARKPEDQVQSQSETQGSTTETDEAIGKEGKRFSSEYKNYLASPEWQERRDRIKPKICAGCHTQSKLQLHHRKYPPMGAPLEAFINQPDSEFSWLCEPCHNAITQSMRSRR